MDLKHITLHRKHVDLGARMVPFAGFELPVRYTSDIEEHTTVRNRVGVFDISHMGEFLIEGSGSLELIQLVTSNDASRLSIGQAQYSCMPNASGGIIDDLLVYRLKENKYMLVVNAANIRKDWNWIQSNNSFGAKMENISHKITLLAVQGPKAVDVVENITSLDLRSMKSYTFETGNIDNIAEGAIFSATGYTGAGGFEIYIYNEFAEQTWNLLFETGKPYGIKPIGLGARDTLRLEMGYCLYGNDIDDTTSPIEAGLGWITKFNKEFISSETLKKQKESGVDKHLAGFKMIDKGIPRHGYTIVNEEGQKAGYVTSGTMSPSMGIGIGMGYLGSEYKNPGTQIFISIRKRNLLAEVVKIPIYKA